MSFLFKKKQQTVHESSNQDREEDGFVLVGETEDEKNTLTPDKPEYHQDLPPMYQFSEGGQDFNQQRPARQQTNSPLYENYSAKTCNQQLPGHGSKAVNGQPGISLGPSSQNSAKLNLKTTVQDIPFKLDDSVACAFNYGKMTVDIGDDFSWTTAQYDYDFTMERSIMRNSENM